jgi:benzoyl-CoA reductase/2-hydroxyglutaryl-CoA dehydratase subunit BcrC/BadD/HgdB
MADIKNNSERRRREHATRAATKIAYMVKNSIIDTLQAKEKGKTLAYTFVYCCYDEIIRAMDIIPIWTENYAGVCGAKRDAERFLSRAESLGFSRSLCSYALCGIGFDQWREELGAMPPDAPWGGQVKPDLMLSSGQLICEPRYKWYQAVQQYMPDVPIYIVDLPWPVYEDDVDVYSVEAYYIEYIKEELHGLVKFLEKRTGRKINWDKLSELVDLNERTWNLIWETYELRRAIPTPMDTGDAMNTMVPILYMMGTQEAHNFFLDLNRELKEKIKRKDGVVSNEKFRLLWGGGLPPWFALDVFNYFNSRGAVFPAEVTYRVIEPINKLNIPDTNDPIERIAWRWLRYWTYWYDKAKKRPGSEPDVERLIQYVEDYQIDGIVVHVASSCRTAHLGLTWQLNQLRKIYKQIPSLILESDMIDIKQYSELHTKNMIDTFVSILESIKEKRKNC